VAGEYQAYGLGAGLGAWFESPPDARSEVRDDIDGDGGDGGDETVMDARAD